MDDILPSPPETTEPAIQPPDETPLPAVQSPDGPPESAARPPNETAVADSAPTLPTAALPAADRLALDLSLGPGFRGRSFAAASWNWPAAVRAAIQLIDHLAMSGELSMPLLPSRVSLDADGHLVVQPATVAEAEPFVAPEVAAGEPADERAAVYHVAAVTYALLIGYPPVGDISRMERLAPELPARLKETLLRALAIDVAQRTATLAAVREQLLFVLVPPLWYEEVVARLPLDDEQRARLTTELDKIQTNWLRLRDRVPWQRLGRTRKRAGEVVGRPRVHRLLTAAGVILALFAYLVLLTDLL